MATASFLKFTLLPLEIQQQIWMVGAESTPGAHFFTYNDEDEGTEITRRNRVIRRTTNVAHPYFGPYLALAVPADDRSIIRTAKQKNDDDFVLGTYQDNGVTRNVIVRSHTDLIILCPIDLGELFRARPTALREGEGGLRELGLAGFRSSLLAEIRRFIDYSLKRRPDAEGYMDDCRDEFWCATGRFVEVREYDDDWDTGPEDGVHKLVASLNEDRETRLKLEEDLEEMGIHVSGGEVKIPPEEPEDPDRTPEWDDPPHGPYFYVLAFEPW